MYVVAVCAVLMLHAGLCHAAATTRGYPPIQSFNVIAIFLAPAAMILPPLFDDFRNDLRSRLWRMAWVAVGFCLVWGVVITNMVDIRPHIGHLAGVSGILTSNPHRVLSWAALCFPPALLFFYCYEVFAIGFWSLVRGFRDSDLSSPLIRDNA